MLALLKIPCYAQENYKIWYDTPAHYWEEAIPIGNGRIAAMVFGNPQLEQLQLNEETVSAGSPYQNYNKEGKGALKEIRRLILMGIMKRPKIWLKKNIISCRTRNALSNSWKP